jgi:uncharacterized protein YbjT (DUF2867 family)
MPHTAELNWVAGASGLVGRALLAELAGQPVLALLRRPASGLPATAGLQTARADYTQPGSFAALPAPTRVFIALGTTMAQAGSRAAFRAADLDAVVTVARAAREAGATHCGLVSALGASTRSAVFYNQVKGEAEDALVALGFERLVIARPSLLDGERATLDQPRRGAEAWTLKLARPLAGLIPAAWRPISPQRIARAMRLALDAPGPAVRVIASGEMQQLGA